MTANPGQSDLGPSEYATLRGANIARQQEWTGGRSDEVDILWRGNELGGEVGEALNVVKKLARERKGWPGSRATVEDLAAELADVVICADLLAMTEGIDLEAAVVAKFNATSEKVGLNTRLLASARSAPAVSEEEIARVIWSEVFYHPRITFEDASKFNHDDVNLTWAGARSRVDDAAREILALISAAPSFERQALTGGKGNG